MRIAIVTPWFGRELIGGAERHAWELAHALADAGTQVDVLATCCRSFNDDWATDYHRAGTAQLAERLRLMRFKVDSRDRVGFNRVASSLVGLPTVVLRGDYAPLDAADARTFVRENINSTSMQSYVAGHADAYDAFVFLPYLYGTTLSILPLVANKAYLMGCLHDEAYAYLEPVRDVFAQARGLLFISAGEEETAAAIYGPGVYAKSCVVGAAVTAVAPPAGPLRLKGFAPHRSRYVLYLGRQVATKNVDFLIEAYEQYRSRQSATALQLVLAGPTNRSRNGDGIVDLGAVNDEAKAALLAHARALAQPSVHESFSRAMYESWFARRPVAVHRRCRATARAVEDSGGGWTAATLAEWADVFAEIDQSSDDRIDALGERGWAAARENGSWQDVARRVLAAVAPSSEPAMRKVDQLAPLGDRRIAAYAAALHDAFVEAGVSSEIVVSEANTARPDAFVVAHLTDARPIVDADAYIVHDAAVAVPRGAPTFVSDQSIGEQLDAHGIVAAYLPRPVSVARWNGVRPPAIDWLNDGPVILSLASLGTGHVQHLIDVFVAFIGMHRTARLLVFASDCTADALETLRHERAELDLERELVILGDEIGEQYAAFRAAAVGLALGATTGVERLVTALRFDLPMLALGDSPDAAMLEAAGVREPTYDVRRCSALLQVIVTDEALRSSMVEEGRRIARRHAPALVTAQLLEGADAWSRRRKHGRQAPVGRAVRG